MYVGKAIASIIRHILEFYINTGLVVFAQNKTVANVNDVYGLQEYQSVLRRGTKLTQYGHDL